MQKWGHFCLPVAACLHQGGFLCFNAQMEILSRLMREVIPMGQE